LTPHQVLIGAGDKLRAPCVQIAILPPHRPLRRVLGMLVRDIRTNVANIHQGILVIK
jgi:hypothetical protein